MQGNQLFGPYGNGRYGAGTINTAKGFIGQYNDSLTGLDYFHARYYDPVVGVFLSADKVQGNWQGMNPYGYVDGNPETKSDPSGQMIEGQNGEYGNIDSQGNLHIWVPYPSYGSGQGYIYRTYFYTHAQLQQPAQDTSGPSSWQKLMDALGITNIENTFADPNATFWDKFGAVAGAVLNDANNLLLAGSILFGGPELAGAEEGVLGGAELLTEGGEEALLRSGEEALAQGEEEALTQGGGTVRNLNLDEQLGGHTLAQHVDVTEEDVFFRAINRGGNASAFYSKGSAAESIQYLIENVAPRIEGNARVFEGAFTRNIGYVYDQLGNRFETNLLRVVQLPYESGWFVLTGYPIL